MRALEVLAVALLERHRRERAVGAVRPGVVRADEVARVARARRADLGAAMRAAVVEGVDRAVGVARDDDALARQPRGEEVARALELAFMAEPQPDPAEDARALLLEHRRVGIEAPVHPPAPDELRVGFAAALLAHAHILILQSSRDAQGFDPAAHRRARNEAPRRPALVPVAWTPRKSALLVIDMQNTFCMPGAPGEVRDGARDRAQHQPPRRRAARPRRAGDLDHPRQHRAERPQRLGSVLRPRGAQRRGEEAHGREPGAGEAGGLEGPRGAAGRRHAGEEPLQRPRARRLDPGARAAQPRRRHRAGLRNQDRRLLRQHRARRHDARLQERAGVRLLRRACRTRSTARRSSFSSSSSAT